MILKRFRLRFSIRTMVIIVTLVCCYAACWGPTKRQGVEDVMQRAGWKPLGSMGLHVQTDESGMVTLLSDGMDASTKIPLVVGLDRTDGLVASHRVYYFWFFGYVAKLPWERELTVDDGPPVGNGLDPDGLPIPGFDFSLQPRNQ
jgi:hypothetical protein